MSTELYDTGLKIRRRVLGDDYVDRALAGADAFNQEFQRLVTEYCWGKVWGRSTLTDRQRSLNNLAMIAALNRGAEFKAHVRGALRNGCTVAEIATRCCRWRSTAGFRRASRRSASRAKCWTLKGSPSSEPAGAPGMNRAGPPRRASAEAAGGGVVGTITSSRKCDGYSGT